MDKNQELKASIRLINEKLHFEGSVAGNAPISIDYTPPLGDNLGYTSLELFLLSLSSCMGSAVLTFLRRMNKTIHGFEVHARGIRREAHPTGFKIIFVELVLRSPDTTDSDVEKVLKLAEDTYCPVWTMIKGNTEVIVAQRVEA
ncbi:MAG: OsmC family protein [Bacteroidales bacterium]|nr:OsmC family protein [Bacteroidales bacterium]